ncbi:hypothetical protein [uncultured Clostridium sp.]|uniref:hypothetical protein n=1 Tax=uncultured Clostridium sp. TaxID=59620 RepID=UPI00261D9095|nr:hypothetical protein [uncultured Clostridium sp.]
MSKLLSKITSLVEVKKIIALTVITVFCILSAKQVVSTEQFTTVATLIVGFYFGSSGTRQAIKETKEGSN